MLTKQITLLQHVVKFIILRAQPTKTLHKPEKKIKTKSKNTFAIISRLFSQKFAPNKKESNF